jgi:outer membrane lipoprotein SlyB
MKSLFNLIFGVVIALSLTACSKETAVTAAPVAPAAAAPAARPAPAAPKEVYVCSDCGTVNSITTIDLSKQNTGAGAAIGAVVGGLLGSQVGDGKGTDAAIVVGVVGGAILGRDMESKRNANVAYDIAVNMENGSYQILRVAEIGSLHLGQEVRVSGSTILPR